MVERVKKSGKRTGFSPESVSPFLTADLGGAAVKMEARPFFGKVLLRGLGEDAAFLKAAESVLGAGLPLTPNTTVAPARGGKSGGAKGKEGKDGGGGVEWERIFWLGPSEWLIWTSGREGLLSALDGGLSDLHSAAVDVSDYYAALRISGDLAREVLAHGCPLDLEGGGLEVGTCAQTRFRAASLLLYCADDAPTYDIQVRWSYAEYLRRYLSEVSALCAAARG